MEPVITVRVVSDNNGGFIAKAVGYPGVVTFGKSPEAAIAKIQEAWNAMAQFNAIKNIGSSRRSRRASPSVGDEINLPLQLA